MNLMEIVWPVFRVSEHKPLVSDGVIYYKSEYSDKGDDSVINNVRIVDNKNIPKDTLGKRRLELLAHDVPLQFIGRAVYFLGDLVKLAKPTTWFIDNSGALFQHKKTNTALLKCYRISKTMPTNGLGTVIEVEGLPNRFKTVFKPRADQYYAGILCMGASRIFYGYYSDPFKDTWRKV